jgi:DNA-binding NtrC family response regulator
MDQAPTILLVEDDQLILQATAETLEEGGCAVRPASSYDEALGALAQCPPDTVLVTDIVLEGPATGLDLIREVHARRPDIGIIVLSGQVRPDTQSLPGKALFCTKPCAPGALLSLVKQCNAW